MRIWPAVLCCLTVVSASSARVTNRLSSAPRAVQSTCPAVRIGTYAKWCESSWADFADGQLDDEMYVSHRATMKSEPGCVEFVARFDADNNGYIDLPVSDFNGPFTRLYLGDKTGYSADRVLKYPIDGGGNVCLADMNVDGYPELYQAGYNSDCQVFWGTATGPSPDKSTKVPGYRSEAIYVHDIDKDGYLDLVAAAAFADQNLHIYWGSPDGYSEKNQTIVPIGQGIASDLALGDFDKDGWTDIAMIAHTCSKSPIVYWGPNRTWKKIEWHYFIDKVVPHGLTTADFNGDGWLDLVYTGHGDITQARVLWGSASGFSDDNTMLLNPGYSYGGSRSADMNGDGWLDLVFLRDNNLPPIIYYNMCKAPFFDDTHSEAIGKVSFNASGGFIADFNHDGYLDLFVNNFDATSSYVLWGPDFNRSTALPVMSDHHGSFREVGSRYDRSYRAAYLSSIYGAGIKKHVVGGHSSWLAYQPEGSGVAVAFRSGNSAVPDETWTDFEYVGESGEIPSSCLGGRYLQYRTDFSYANPCYLPWLEEIDNALVISGQTSLAGAVMKTTNAVRPILASDGVIEFSTATFGPVTIQVFDGTGRLVRRLIDNEAYPAGNHVVAWGGTDQSGKKLTAGTYFTVLEATNSQQQVERKSAKLIVAH